MVRSLDLITFKNLALPMYSYFLSMISVVLMKRINGKPTTGVMILSNTMFQKVVMPVTPTILMHGFGNSKMLLQPITNLILVLSWMWSTITSTKQMSTLLNRSFLVISTAIMQRESGPMEPSAEMTWQVSAPW